MVKCEVIQQFTLSRFGELKNVVRRTNGKDGELYVGDTFECSQELAEYLTGKNEKGKVVVKVIEVKPIKVKKEFEDTNTNTLQFTQSDFDDFNDLKEDMRFTKVLVRILIVIIVIVFIVGCVLLANKIFNLRLF